MTTKLLTVGVVAATILMTAGGPANATSWAPTFPDSVLRTALAKQAVPASSADPTNLIENPDFTPTNAASSPIQLNVAPVTDVRNPGFSTGAEIAPWHVTGFALLFGRDPDSPSRTNSDVSPGARNQFSTGGFCFWGPGNGCGQPFGPHRNGLTLGPSDGNFVALDGAVEATTHADPVACLNGQAPCSYGVQASISQTIAGLKIGEPTTVEFTWAAAQQAHFFGDTTEQVQVSLCPTDNLADCPSADKLKTGERPNPQFGFQDWMKGVTQDGHAFTFIPTSPREVLTFLAIGTPSARPPFVLLDGTTISLTQQAVPEPATWSLLVIGFAVAGVAVRRRKWLDVPA